ncbi:type II secretion system protein [Persephonella sp.]
MEKKDSSGFTLIEVLIVLAIIAILSSIALLQYNKMKENAYKAAVKTDVRNTLESILNFKIMYSKYPDSGSCGPGPQVCTLHNGSYIDNKGVVVSKGVTITWQIGGTCSDSSTQILITGSHKFVSGWQFIYDSCENRFR